MHSHELTLGRTFGVVFDHGDDFFPALTEFCQANGVRQGFVPGFLGAFGEVDLVGTCGKVDDPGAPVWSEVHLTYVEVIGSGTLAWDDDEEVVRPHVHVSAGLKQHSATAHTSHLLGARVQFVTELLVVEVTSPRMQRPPAPDLYDIPLLGFTPTPHLGGSP